MPHYERKDHFYKKAKKEGYPSRAAYKLIEMDQKFKVFKKSERFVDLGCAPGGWLKVIEDKTKNLPKKKICGIDLLPLQYKAQDSTLVLEGDFLDEDQQRKICDFLGGTAQWIVSDMSPNLSGIKFRDLEASAEIVEAALSFAEKNLSQGGGLIMKVFPGPSEGTIKKRIRKKFAKLHTYKPASTRKSSDEVYWIAQDFKPKP